MLLAISLFFIIKIKPLEAKYGQLRKNPHEAEYPRLLGLKFLEVHNNKKVLDIFIELIMLKKYNKCIVLSAQLSGNIIVRVDSNIVFSVKLN